LEPGVVIRCEATQRALAGPDVTAAVPNVEVRIAVIRSVAALNAAVDLTSAVGPNAMVRIEVIQNAVTPSVVTQGAMADFPNAVVQAVVLNVVQDVVPDVVLQSAATRCGAAPCVRVAVFQCVADLDAMVVLQNVVVLQNAAAKVLPDAARGDVPAGLHAPDAVHAVQCVAEVEAAQVAAPVAAWLPVVQSVEVRYCRRRECCLVAVRSRPDYAGYHLRFDSDVRSDRDVHRAVDPVTWAVQDDLLRRLAAFPFAEFRPCLAAVKSRVSVRAHGKYVCVADLHRETVPGGVPLRRSADREYPDAELFELVDPSCRPHVHEEYSRRFHPYDPVELQFPDRD